MAKLHRIFLLALLTLFVIWAPADAVVWSPDCCGFSADFPTAPDFQPMRHVVVDAQGRRLLSNGMSFAARSQNTVAVVAVDIFAASTALEPRGLLLVTRNDFLKDDPGEKVTSERFADFDGFPSLSFDIKAGSDAPGVGHVMIVVRNKPVPRVLLVATDERPGTTAAEHTALDRFRASFKLHELARP